MTRATILYEDSREPRSKGFGLHALVKQCICDERRCEPWDIKDDDLNAIPKNGADKVRLECQKNMKRLTYQGGLVFAVYDSDKIRGHLKLPAATCKRTIVGALKKECVSSDRLDVVLLERNMESVLIALRSIDSSLVSPEAWDAAIAGKALAARDQILNNAATPDPSRRPVRDSLRKDLTSFNRLVKRVERALALPPRGQI